VYNLNAFDKVSVLAVVAVATEDAFSLSRNSHDQTIKW